MLASLARVELSLGALPGYDAIVTVEPLRALAAGAHEGVLKGSGRMIVGSVSAEVYRRIE